MALFISESEVAQLLDMGEALGAIEAAHAAHGVGEAIDVPRQRTRLPQAALHILQGALPGAGVFGYKAYTTSRVANRFLVHLFDAESGALLAVIEADRLGMMRTGAVAGVAAKWLARPQAAVVGLFGAGWQAQSQLEALCHVRTIRLVKVQSRNEERRHAFCAEMSARLGVEVRPASGAEDAVRGSDIVATITTATAPLFDGDWLAAGTHVSAAGSNALIRREIDDKTVQRAAVICVDSRATALRECGDLLTVLEKGRLHPGQWVELGELVVGRRPGRSDSQQITLFESQGMAIQDLVLAERVLKLARERGLGRELPF
jgi:alanine dehydrogenase